MVFYILWHLLQEFFSEGIGHVLPILSFRSMFFRIFWEKETLAFIYYKHEAKLVYHRPRILDFTVQLNVGFYWNSITRVQSKLPSDAAISFIPRSARGHWYTTHNVQLIQYITLYCIVYKLVFCFTWYYEVDDKQICANMALWGKLYLTLPVCGFSGCCSRAVPVSVRWHTTVWSCSYTRTPATMS